MTTEPRMNTQVPPKKKAKTPFRDWFGRTAPRKWSPVRQVHTWLDAPNANALYPTQELLVSGAPAGRQPLCVIWLDHVIWSSSSSARWKKKGGGNKRKEQKKLGENKKVRALRHQIVAQFCLAPTPKLLFLCCTGSQAHRQGVPREVPSSPVNTGIEKENMAQVDQHKRPIYSSASSVFVREYKNRVRMFDRETQTHTKKRSQSSLILRLGVTVFLCFDSCNLLSPVRRGDSFYWYFFF